MADFNWKRFVNFIAYVALIFVAVALVFVKFIPKLTVLKEVAEIIAYTITAVFAFMYARSKRNPWVMAFFVIATIVLVVFLFV